MAPLVSIVITTYNYAEYLARCVDSVLDQTYQNIEVIIVNDGSTDNTDQIVDRYHKSGMIRYIKQQNAGQTIAKNNGLRECTGEFIAFLDADDYWMRDKLEKQLAVFAGDEKLGVVYTRAKWIDKNDKPTIINDLKTHSGWVTNHFVFDNFVHFSSVLVRKNCFEDVGVFDESLDMGIDWELWLRVSKYYKFAFIDEQLIAYRVGHQGQMSHKQVERHQQSDYILERFIRENPGLVSMSILRKANAYTYRNRGDYYATIDRKLALHYNIRSLSLNPIQPRVYVRILKLLFQPVTTRLRKT